MMVFQCACQCTQHLTAMRHIRAATKPLLVRGAPGNGRSGWLAVRRSSWRLTTFSDYALRVLMYAAVAGDRLITIEETAKTYNISRAHLMKVVNILTRTGYLKGVRGRAGGFTLAKSPEAINLGTVVRATEPDF